MHYLDVYSTDELNQKVADYVAFGYKVESRTPTSARLVKNNFSWGIFIILFLFVFIIGAIIYWAVKSGNKDEVIIRIKESTTPNSIPINNVNPNVVKYCSKCGGGITIEDSKFCPNCGAEIN